MIVFSGCLVLVLAIFPQTVPDGSKKPAPPEAKAQRDAEKLVRDIFKDDYAKKAPADRIALAQKLLDQALQNTTDDPVNRFVLLQEARDVAAQAGDAALAGRAIDGLGTYYDIDKAGMKLTVTAALAKGPKTPEELAALARADLAIVDEALAADQFETAQKAVDAAVALAKRVNQSPLLSRAETRGREVADRKFKYEKARKSRETLATNPEDAVANGIVGQYECLVKGNWDGGLSYLAKGSDAGLKAVATQDVAKPAGGPERLAVGEGWWNLSEKETGAAKLVLRARARHWYELAFPSLTGLPKTKIEKRLAELRFDVFKGSWIDMTDAKSFGLDGKPGEPVEMTSSSGMKQIFLQKPPPWDFDGVSARIRWKGDPRTLGILLYEGNNRASYVDHGGDTFIVNHNVKNTWTQAFSAGCAKKDDYMITVLLVDGEYILYLDGKEMTREKTTFSRLLKVGFQVENGSILVDQFRVRKKE